MGASPSSRLRSAASVIGPGSVLGNRYRLEHHIATGGMGEVWAAADAVLERCVAVKILKPELVEAGGFLARFRAEARHAAPLSHPGIASVFDYGEDDHDGTTVAYLVMELIHGETLSELLARVGVPPLHTTLAVLRQCADALGDAHRSGVVHRDVKPANIMLVADPMVDGGAVKMTDFGIARAIRSVPITHAGETVGTPHYMAPEQATGSTAITPAADVYSLGVIAHEMLSGRKPFERDHPAAVAMAQVHDAPPPLPSWVPVRVADLVGRALSKDPFDRPRDGAEMAAALRAIEQPAATTPTLVRTPAHHATEVLPALTTPMPLLMPLGRRRRSAAWWWAAALLVAALIVGGVALAARRQDDSVDGVPPVVTAASGTVAPPAPTTVVAVTQPPTTVAAEPAPPPKGHHGKDGGKGKGNQGG